MRVEADFGRKICNPFVYDIVQDAWYGNRAKYECDE